VRHRTAVSADKLRGGFYTPADLVGACLARVDALLAPDAAGLRVLEPSAGDGAFLRALSAWGRAGEALALEPHDTPALAGLAGRVLRGSAVAWAADTEERFDVAVGNPPFVRYQFVGAADRAAADRLGARLGLPLTRVGNLWIPVLLGALARLRDGGVFAFVVPAECLTGVAGAAVRRWLLDECADVGFDAFPPGAFGDVLQGVLVLSGRRRRGGSVHVRVDGATHVARDTGPWTRYRLTARQLAALDAHALRPLGEVATFEVSIVTGANGWFCVDDATRREHGLERWARPLLPRIRHAPGLRYTRADHAAARLAGARTWLLDFADGAPPPAYLAAGVALGLPARYKCRIREPWYRVPGIRAGELLLSKRSHLHPRVVVNAAGALTTDTIYRGRMLAGAPPAALAAGFHNTRTLLGAELDGRSFGGGVLELVPSEIARLPVALAAELAAELPRLDALARRDAAAVTGRADPERVSALVAATDALLVRAGVLDADALPDLRAARATLLADRLHRAQASRARAAA
jgi:hypothetical protein